MVQLALTTTDLLFNVGGTLIVKDRVPAQQLIELQDALQQTVQFA